MDCRKPLLIALLLAAALPLAGCGSPTSASFAVRDTVDELMTGRRKEGNARDKVADTVEKFFGTPDALVVWERLPIDFGGIPGRVVVPEGEEASTRKLTIEWAGDVDPVEGPAIEPGSTVMIRPGLGEEAETSFTVAAYDHSSRRLSLTDALPEPPADGATVLVAPGSQLVAGKKLYLEHCMHCHGVAGDGNGPTAMYFAHPKPRDYRNGLFKFTSTKAAFKAQRADLERIVRQGIPGTYMPSFLLLKDDEMKAIVEYVRWLACRGEMEKFLADNLAGKFTKKAYDEADKEGRQALIADFEKYLVSTDEFDGWNALFKESVDDKLVDKWTAAEKDVAVIVPTVPRTESTPESIARGRAIFVGGKAKCMNCHGRGGRGDGPQTTDFQDNPVTKTKYDVPGLHDVWGNPIEPRNLTLGLYRGGRRPIDVFRRIHSGIKGTPMQGFAGPLSDADIWDVVNYVMSLPYDESTESPDPPAEPVSDEPAPMDVEPTPADADGGDEKDSGTDDDAGTDTDAVDESN